MGEKRIFKSYVFKSTMKNSNSADYTAEKTSERIKGGVFLYQKEGM